MPIGCWLGEVFFLRFVDFNDAPKFFAIRFKNFHLWLSSQASPNGMLAVGDKLVIAVEALAVLPRPIPCPWFSAFQ